MGGVSRSLLQRDPAGHAVIKGEVSLERNGGFASVQSGPGAGGKPGAEVCLMEVRATGKRFKLNLITEYAFDGLNYQSSLEPEGHTWQTLQPQLQLATFRATFRAGPIDLNRFRRFLSGSYGVRLRRPKAEAARRRTPCPEFEPDGSSASGACCRS